MELCRSIAFLVFVVSTSSAFDIVSVSPASTTVPYGGKIKLTCKTDGYYEFCKFVHNTTAKFCDFVWLREPYNVTTKECTDFKGRARFIGSYDNYECGLELDNVTPEGNNECIIYEDHYITITL